MGRYRTAPELAPVMTPARRKDGPSPVALSLFQPPLVGGEMFFGKYRPGPVEEEIEARAAVAEK